MRRRNLIFGLLAIVTTGGARAQSRKARHIAVVDHAFPVTQITETSVFPFWKGFFNELRRLGYVEGSKLPIERFSGEGRAADYPDLVHEVVGRNPDLIIAVSNQLALGFKAATTTIPVVGFVADPLRIVSSLARPGGNITGVADDVGQEQWEKRIQLLHQVVPQASRFGLLQSRGTQDSADRCLWTRTCPPGFTVVGSSLDYPIDEAEYRRAFAALTQNRAEAIVVSDDEENQANFRLIPELAEKFGLPAIYPFKMYVEAGGLMSYGPDLSAIGQRAAEMADQILKGAKPSEIPIAQPTKIELAINLKTAKALGLTVPPELLATADEVIE